MAKAVGLLPNGYCLFAKVRASLPDSTDVMAVSTRLGGTLISLWLKALTRASIRR